MSRRRRCWPVLALLVAILAPTSAWSVASAAACPAAPRWLVAADGGLFSVDGAPFFGSAAGWRLNRSIVGMAATPSGRGYWLVAADGGIFTFGDARYFGSAATVRLRAPVAGMAVTPSGRGYWLVAADGGVFAFGDARFAGSAAASPLAWPAVAIAATASGHGYWLLTGDRVVPFGDAAAIGPDGGLVAEGPRQAPDPAVAFATTSARDGYWILRAGATVLAEGAAVHRGVPVYLRHPRVGIAASGDGYVVADARGASEVICPSGPNRSTSVRSAAPVVGVVAVPPAS